MLFLNLYLFYFYSKALIAKFLIKVKILKDEFRRIKVKANIIFIFI